MSEQVDFWDERVRQFGHTGFASSVIYAYDQPARLKAISSLLNDLNVPTELALDLGTGTGDFAAVLAGKFKRVLAFDISHEVIRVARADHKQANIDFVQGRRATELPIDDGSLGMVLSITVLQHILTQEELRDTLRFLRAKLADDGMFLILESTPAQPKATSYISFRTFEQWKSEFEACGFSLFKDSRFQSPDFDPAPSFEAYRRRRLVKVLAHLRPRRLASAMLQRIARPIVERSEDFWGPGKSDDQIKIMIFRKNLAAGTSA